VPVRQLLKCKDIHVRAWDSTLNTQPRDLNWNLMGMMNNCWYRVQVDLAVSGEDAGELMLTFTHPTVPGPESGGGWMGPKADEVDKEDVVARTNRPAPILTTAITKSQPVENKTEDAVSDTATSTTDRAVATVPSGAKFYTADMVSKHSTDDDCWIIHSGKVYDCTAFLQEHPGGAD
ncbi:hypothetical protein BGZ70_006584, partial [Mortierella alpina]